jgi:hypothetical protein
MKKIFLLFFNIYPVIFPVFGQERTLYVEIQQAKNANTRFESIVLTGASSDAEELKAFISPDEVFFFENNAFDSRNSEAKAISLFIPVSDRGMVLELVEVPEYFYDYTILTSDWEEFAPNRDIKHYRGVVRDDERSLVAVTFYGDEIMGLVCTDEGNFNIARNKRTGKHLFYSDKNLKEKMEWHCDTEFDPSVIYDPEDLIDRRADLNSENVTTRSTSINKIVKFFVETEFDIFQNRGSVAAVEAYVLGLFHQVGILYHNEEISTGVSFLHIWTSNVSYPYAGKNTTADLLAQFRITRTSIIGDLGMLLTSRNIGGRAGVGGLCHTSTANKLGVAGLDINSGSNPVPVPVYSWAVKVVTHELGHLIGSPHTHDCVWNPGGNSAIDGCGPNAGYPGNGNCTNPGNPPGGGTIMSYCDQQPTNGTPYVGINFNLGFGPQPGTLIRNKVIAANCLQACDLTINNQTYNLGKHSILGCIVNISNTTINPNTTVNIYGRETVILNPGFQAMAGSHVMISVGEQAHVITNQ